MPDTEATARIKIKALLIKGRLTFTPQAGHYAFAGEGTTQPLFVGLVQLV